jgi:hypothetical protein
VRVVEQRTRDELQGGRGHAFRKTP